MNEDKKAAVDACIAMAGSIVHGIKDAQNYGHISSTEAFELAYEAVTSIKRGSHNKTIEERKSGHIGRLIAQKLELDELLETDDE